MKPWEPAGLRCVADFFLVLGFLGFGFWDLGFGSWGFGVEIWGLGIFLLRDRVSEHTQIYPCTIREKGCEMTV